MTAERGDDAAFRGVVVSRRFGAVAITTLRTAPVRVVRGRTEQAAAPLEAFYVGHQLHGPCTIEHAGETRMIEAGDLALIDATRPSVTVFDRAFTCIVAVVPHHLLRPRMVDPDAALRQVVRGGTSEGALVTSYLTALARSTLPAPSGDAAGNVLLDLLALALNAPASRAPSNDSVARDARRRAIVGFIDCHLGDPALRPAAVAAHFRISPRYLDALFAEIGTSVMRHVLACRLDRARVALRDPARRARTITDVAVDLGFHDPSYFGRAFKAAFGITPRDWRAGAPK
jgi:AraC-like DNA-binding protein